MGRIYCVLMALILAAILAAATVEAQWVYVAMYILPTDIEVATLEVLEDSGYIVVGTRNLSRGSTPLIVLDTNLSEVDRYELLKADSILAVDYYNGLLAAAALYGNDTNVYVINMTEGVILGVYTISSFGGPDYAVYPVSIGISGSYIFVVVEDWYDNRYYLYIIDKDITSVEYKPLAPFAKVKRIENTGYLVFWNGTSNISVIDGSLGTLYEVASIDLGLVDLHHIDAVLDPSSNVLYIAYSNGSGTFFTRYLMGATEPTYTIKIEYDIMEITDVSLAGRDVYVTTIGGYGYRIVNPESPSIVKEAIPKNAYGYYYGSEFIYAALGSAVYKYSLTIKTETVTKTVTKTVTETQIIEEVETETVTTTTTVGGPYTETDVFIIGAICFVLGISIAFLVWRRT